MFEYYLYGMTTGRMFTQWRPINNVEVIRSEEMIYPPTSVSHNAHNKV
ncbi:Uncharacterised protein [Yersinia frederiksenii]|nr:Uncharacterised protein [Yersinia frederiksenii]CNK89706.1 Uncharacterised protein [Yersinia frederiksenii]CQH32063.1 Uncharacterised protein [Yersinia frederiksenii]